MKMGWMRGAGVAVPACLCFVGIGRWLMQKPAGDHLLARATRRYAGGEGYQWLTDRDILFIQFQKPSASENRVAKWDVETGTISPLRTFKSRQRNFGIGEAETVLSPDKTKLIWIGSSYLVLPLASSQQRAFPHGLAPIIGGMLPFVPSVVW